MATSSQLQPNPIAALDTPLAQVESAMARLVARQRLAALNERIAAAKASLLPSAPASAGDLAEYSHLLHDADTDAVTHAFPDLRKGTTWRTK